MEKVKRFASASLLLLVAAVAGAQDKKVETTVALDMVSHYVWRGQDLGSVSLQPTLGIAYK
jgi:CO/xanthine dehydrogenase FAD-binding subunit